MVLSYRDSPLHHQAKEDHQHQQPHQPVQQQQQPHTSERCEMMSVKSQENSARLDEILDWIEGIPLSKPAKNLARDFSDAVLMSEVLKFYYPQVVAAHNYFPTNSIVNKRENWNTLNRKVLAKIDMRLSPESIEQLVHAQPGAIDKVLLDFRDKQMAVNVKDSDFNDTETDEAEELSKEIRLKISEENRSFLGKVFCSIKNFFSAVFAVIIAVLCFWRWFSGKSKNESIPRQVDRHEDQLKRAHEDHELRKSYNQALQELRVKCDVIKTLCHKVAFLEGTIKLKDMKIATLTGQLDQQQQPQQASIQEPVGQISSAKLSHQSSTNIKARIKRPRIQT